MQGEVTSDDPDRLLTGAEVAGLLGIAAATWRSLVAQGYAPPADDPGVGPVNRRAKRWHLSTVRAFQRSRPGSGARTDLNK